MQASGINLWQYKIKVELSCKYFFFNPDFTSLHIPYIPALTFIFLAPEELKLHITNVAPLNKLYRLNSFQLCEIQIGWVDFNISFPSLPNCRGLIIHWHLEWTRSDRNKIWFSHSTCTEQLPSDSSTGTRGPHRKTTRTSANILRQRKRHAVRVWATAPGSWNRACFPRRVTKLVWIKCYMCPGQ